MKKILKFLFGDRFVLEQAENVPPAGSESPDGAEIPSVDEDAEVAAVAEAEAEKQEGESEVKGEVVRHLSEMKLDQLKQEMGTDFMEMEAYLRLNDLEARMNKINLTGNLLSDMAFIKVEISNYFKTKSEQMDASLYSLLGPLAKGMTPDGIRGSLAEIYADVMAVNLQNDYDSFYKGFFTENQQYLADAYYKVQYNSGNSKLVMIYSDDAKINNERSGEYNDFKNANPVSQEGIAETQETQGQVMQKYIDLKNNSMSGFIAFFGDPKFAIPNSLKNSKGEALDSQGDLINPALYSVAAGASFLGGFIAGMMGVTGFEKVYTKIKEVIGKYSPEAVAIIEPLEESAKGLADDLDVTEEEGEGVAEVKEVGEGYFNDLANGRTQKLTEGAVKLNERAFEGKKIQISLGNDVEEDAKMSFKGVDYRDVSQGDQIFVPSDSEVNVGRGKVMELVGMPADMVIPRHAVLRLV